MNINARLYEAVEAAGGFLEEADTGWLNQAEILSDGDQVRIYSKEETQKMQEAGMKEESGTAREKCGNESAKSDTRCRKGNISMLHRAEELQTIFYPELERQRRLRSLNTGKWQGEFKSTEEIQNVPGIKGKNL